MFDSILEFTKDNVLLTGLMGVYGLGVITFLLKDVPKAFGTFIIKQVTTSVIIQNKNVCFFRLMSLLDETNISHKLRTFRFYNGRWGNSSTILKGLSEGSHLIWYNRVPIKVVFTNNNTASFDNNENLQVKLIKFGRSHKIFDQLKTELEKEEVSIIGKTAVSAWYDNYWQDISSIPKRLLSSVLFDQDKKKELITRIETFISSEKWYIENGVPYQLGILLYGPPGTGKTSLIKAIAGYFDYSICTLPSSCLFMLQKAIAILPEKAILVIEDIDSAKAIHKREDEPEAKSGKTQTTEANNSVSLLQLTSLSDILNSVDGILSKHGRILITTTNALDKIDPAFLRPGRIDIKIELGYVSTTLLQEFIKKFYGSTIVNLQLHIKEKVAMAQLQDAYLSGYTLEEFLDKFCM
jgi:chaperone BCS1